MGEWVDFKTIKQQVTMQMVLDRYTIKLRRSGKSELRGRCPIHKGEGTDAFHVSTDKNAFQCFSCGAKGNVLDLVAALEGCSIREAALKVQTWFSVSPAAHQTSGRATKGSQLATKKIGEKREAKTVEINPPLTFQLRVDPGHPYGESRGLSRETLEYLGAGFCLSKGTFAGRFVIPLHDEQGRLVGYTGRAVDDKDPKYLFPSAEKGFHKRLLLFNLHRVLKEPPTDGTVVVVEGFFDCMKVHQAGYACVGLLGSSLSAEQEELLCKYFQRGVLMFDGDEAGRKAADDCLLRLGRRMFVRAVELPEGKQPDMLKSDELKAQLEG